MQANKRAFPSTTRGMARTTRKAGAACARLVARITAVIVAVAVVMRLSSSSSTHTTERNGVRGGGGMVMGPAGEGATEAAHGAGVSRSAFTLPPLVVGGGGGARKQEKVAAEDRHHGGAVQVDECS